MKRRRVVITGLGAITALGEGAGVLWEAALAGRSGIDTLRFDYASSPRVGGAIRNFNPERFITQKKAIKLMARDIQLAVAAAGLALGDAEGTPPLDSRIKTPDKNHDRFGVIVGSGVLNHELDELAGSFKNALAGDGRPDLKKFGEEGISSLFPLWLLKYLPNMPACHISILFDLRGPNNTITTGASAGLQAPGEAFRIIQRGAADLMLAGGAESKLNPVGFSQYKILGVLSEANGRDPRSLYKPFDTHADGFVIGEAAAFVVLEEREHALDRGVTPYAEVAGFGSSSAAGRAAAMEAALDEAGISPPELAYIQASGLGLGEEDLREAEAIESVFNSAGKQITVSASKPVTGYAGFSAGALDLIFSTLALRHQTIAPTLNFQKAKRPWDFQIAKGQPVQKKIDYAMTNSFGFNGQSVSMITKAFHE